MIVSIVPIGNSKGIRIPKFILEELQIRDTVDLTVSDDKLVVTPVKRKPREGWYEAFSSLHGRSDDALLISDSDVGGGKRGSTQFGWDT
ncbi:MAG: AbrB/MazE/SpoVT family DNA-binding domain-containing protein [Spirochaetota bacterium]